MRWKMNDWKQLFKPHILERGYEYFFDDSVDCITKNKGTYMATVHGSEGYHVQIKISKEKVKEMYCDCPFAADGKHCKHMAAMLYELEAIEEQSLVNEVEMMKAEFYFTLDKRSKKELVDMIIQYADDEFILKALSGSSEKAKEQLIKKMYKQFDLIIKNNTYADGSIDYQNAYRFCDKLGEFIYPALNTFFEDIGHMETFDFILHCAEDLAYLEFEDYDCGLYEIENELEYYLKEAIEKSTQDEKERIRKTLKRFMDDHPYFFSEEVGE